ncbi:hypothetical protein LSCM1_06828 [Leishmania martiniquensis]|uniref:Uncharacterized protein n=1 Tax=Leishmania martiniquensis TaxID=1580590 RepID=A0A836KYQ0_9TRYP|nr:hypothetical protein LSCM1_06828 [Leishmania martiniquensis]
MSTAAHRDAAAVGGHIEVSFTGAFDAPADPTIVTHSDELNHGAQFQGVVVDTLTLNASGSPPAVAQVPLPGLGGNVESLTTSRGSPALLSTATNTTAATTRGSSHTHPHLLHIIKQQQQRIATLQALLARIAKGAQHSYEALGSLRCQSCASARAGRDLVTDVASPVVGGASPLLALVAEVSSAVAATVRWADCVAATPMLPSPVSRDGFTEWRDDSPEPKCCSLTPSSPSTAPATCSLLPVILLDITSMFTTRSARAVAARPDLREPPLSTHRRCSDTQTEWAATEFTTLSDKGTSGSGDAAGRLVNQLRGELAELQRRLKEAEALISSLRAATLALQHQGSAPGASCESADVVTSPKSGAVDASRIASVSDVSRARCDGAAAERLVYGNASKEMEELQRLRLLLRFSELKKDSDRLAEVESALREASAAQSRLQSRCDRLEHEKTQRGSCLRAIASCVETALGSLSNGAFGNRRDDNTAAAAAMVALPDKLVAVLRYILRLCTDAAPSPGAQKASSPMQRPSRLQALKALVRPRQGRLQKALSDSREGGQPLPPRSSPRRTSWRGSGEAAAAALGERRGRKQ